MGKRTSAAAAAIILLAAFFVDHPGGDVPAEIGTAVQQLRQGPGGAARTTEEVRYDDVDVEVIASYAIAEGVLTAAAPAEHVALWTLATRVLPPAQLASVRQLNVVTDGVHGVLAMVHRSRLTAGGWVLTVDPAERERVLEETLVHELAHLLTLGPRDVSVTDSPCRAVSLPIGCAHHGSALAAWASAFWDERAAVGPTAPVPDRFVSEYAATGPHEDLAETFVAFVYGPPADPPATIREKLAFFDAWPELVEARTHVRASLGLG